MDSFEIFELVEDWFVFLWVVGKGIIFHFTISLLSSCKSYLLY